MAQQTINRGSAAGDGTGESLYSAFGKVNSNFTELYAQVAAISTFIDGGSASSIYTSEANVINGGGANG